MSTLIKQKSFKIPINFIEQEDRYNQLLEDLKSYGNDEYFFITTLERGEKKYYHVIHKDIYKSCGADDKEKIKKYKSYKFGTLKDFIIHIFKLYDIDTDLYFDNKKAIETSVEKALSKQFPVKIIFDPKSEQGLIEDEGFALLNSFKKTRYMQIANTIKERHAHLSEEDFKKAFPYFSDLLLNLCENNYNYVKILLNHFANIVQRREKTNVLFVFKSMQGAGKGIMLENILAPLLHKDQVITKSLDALDKRFNADLAEALLIAIDESQYDAKKNNKTSEKIKQIASNKKIEIEKKNINSEHLDTFFNLIAFTNNSDGIKIDVDDRRYYVFEGVMKLEVLIKKKYKNELKKYNNSFIKFIECNLVNNKVEKEKLLTYISTLLVNEDFSKNADLANESKIQMMFSTNNLVDIFTKAIERKNKYVLKYLYEKLVEINEENKFENAENEDQLPVFSREELDRFFIDLIEKGKVAKSLTHRIVKVFLSQNEKTYGIKRISSVLDKRLKTGKDSKGIRYYKLETPAEFTAEEFFNEINNKELELSEIFEESFTLNELDNLLAEASNI